MKKTLLFSLLLTVVSCQKESIHTEPISANADQEILGTWTVDAVQLWDGNDIQEIHTTQQTLEFTSDGRLIVIGGGAGGTTLTEGVKYRYEVNASKYFLRIIEPNRVYQGCLVYLRPKGNGWQLGFSRPTGSDTNILWNYHCTK